MKGKAEMQWYIAALIVGVVALVLIAASIILLVGTEGSITNAFNAIFGVGTSYAS